MQNTMLDSTVSSDSQELFSDFFRGSDLDACDCLEIGNTSDALADLDDDDKLKLTRDELDALVSKEGIKCSVDSRVQSLNLVSESGLYDLIMQSRKPEAKAFKRWVTHEVLPSIRKTGSYGVAQPTIFDYARALIAEKERSDALEAQNKALTAERDEAIRTKAMIGSRREATAMATASAKSRECEKLREQIGDSETYKRATAIPWLSEYFDTRNDGLYNSLAAQLRKIEASMPPEFAHKPTPDTRYGSVKAYHIAVIERFHEIVREKLPVDKKFMEKYRKDVSPKTKNA